MEDIANSVLSLPKRKVKRGLPNQIENFNTLTLHQRAI